MLLSIVVVNYNGRHHLDGCLGSIAEHVSCAHEVIVVDNASSDGSAAFLRSAHPEVALVQSERNLGFAAGNNLGARSATGTLLLLLNNDTRLLGDLSCAVELIRRDSSVGVVGARMVGASHEYRLSAGRFPEPLRLTRFSSLYERSGPFRTGDFPADVESCPVDWVEGSFLLTRTELWRALGGLDEDYFMYLEDVDYARRVKDRRKRVVYCPRVSYVHAGGYATDRYPHLVAGFRTYHRKHSGAAKRWFAGAALNAGLITRSAVFFLCSIADPSQRGRAALCLRALRGAR
jgi:GT2 family glycosyltransferase